MEKSYLEVSHSKKGNPPSELDSDTDHEEPKINDPNPLPIDSTNFVPTHYFYFLPHNLFSTSVKVLDLTSVLENNPELRYTSGDINDKLRDAARALSKDKSQSEQPAWQFERKHWWSSTAKMTNSKNGTEVGRWHHPSFSGGTAEVSFPHDSCHSSHDMTVAPPHWYQRRNEWVQESVPYAWHCDSKMRANRMTLFKTVGGKSTVVGKYTKRWGSWVTGGLLLVNAKETDEAVAVLTCCIMLRRMQQRASERSRFSGGGGGGGDGG